MVADENDIKPAGPVPQPCPRQKKTGGPHQTSLFRAIDGPASIIHGTLAAGFDLDKGHQAFLLSHQIQFTAPNTEPMGEKTPSPGLQVVGCGQFTLPPHIP